MRVFLTNNLFFPLADFIRKRKVIKNYKQLLKSQWFNSIQLREIQEQKLREIITHCNLNVPFYKERMKKSGFDIDSNNYLKELEKIPVLERAEIRRAFASKEILAKNFDEYQTKEQKTSGSSTGEPLSTMEDNLTADLGRASFYRGLKWANWELGEPSVKLWGQRSPKGTLKLRLANKIINWETFNAFSMDDDLFLKFYNYLIENKVQHIYSYVSTLVQFIKFVEAKKLVLPPIKSIITTAEVLTVYAKEQIEEAFNTKVFNGYACGEINGIAYQCEHRSGFHISMERCIVEVVDDKGEVLPYGQYGRLAITDFYNHAMPLIRYINGDEGVLTDEKCACGRNLIRINEIAGRTSDIIDSLNNKKVHSTYFHVVFIPKLDWQKKYGLKKYQFIQESVDTLRVIMNLEINPPEIEIEEMKNILREQLGPMKINFTTNVNDFENSAGGKFAWAINKTRTKIRKNEFKVD